MTNKLMKVLPVIHILNEQQAIDQAELLVNSGCDGFWLINHAGDDYLTLALALMMENKYQDHIVGVNLLSKTGKSAIDAVVESGIKYLWLDAAGVHSETPDKELLGYIKNVSEKNDVVVFAGAAFKYQKPEPNPGKAAELAKEHGFKVTTSGSGTGHAADVDKIASMSSVVEGELAIASGLTVENLDDYHPYVEYALIATGISLDDHYFDPKKLSAFVKKAHALNSLIAED